MYELILWGNASDYDFYKHHILNIFFSTEIQITGFVCNENIPWKNIDDIPVLPIEALLNTYYDYLVDMNRINLDMCKQIIEVMKLDKTKIIKGSVLSLPAFEINEYLYLRSNPVTIISPNCWGGLTYNSLGLEFDSPFINTRIYRDDYYKLLNNLEEYLKCPIEFDHIHTDADDPSITHPVMHLGDVKIHFVHATSPTQAEKEWTRRIPRIHFDNLLIHDFMESEEETEQFLSLPFEHKIGFSAINISHPDIIYFPFEQGSYYHNKYVGIMNAAIYSHASNKLGEFQIYDTIKLLNHRSDYMRVL